MESLSKLLARNAQALRKHRHMSEPDMIKAGVPAGSAHRVLTGQNVTLDVLAKVARALRVQPWQLLAPAFHAANPPVLADDPAVEAEIERRVNQRVADVLNEAGKLLNVDRGGNVAGSSVAVPYPAGPAAPGEPRSARAGQATNHRAAGGPADDDATPPKTRGPTVWW